MKRRDFILRLSQQNKVYETRHSSENVIIFDQDLNESENETRELFEEEKENCVATQHTYAETGAKTYHELQPASYSATRGSPAVSLSDLMNVSFLPMNTTSSLPGLLEEITSSLSSDIHMELNDPSSLGQTLKVGMQLDSQKMSTKSPVNMIIDQQSLDNPVDMSMGNSCLFRQSDILMSYASQIKQPEMPMAQPSFIQPDTSIDQPSSITQSDMSIDHPSPITQSDMPIDHQSPITQEDTPIDHPSIITQPDLPMNYPSQITQPDMPISYPSPITQADIPVSHSSSYTEPGKPTIHSSPIARPNTSMGHSSSFTEPNVPIDHQSPITQEDTPIDRPSIITQPDLPMNYPSPITQPDMLMNHPSPITQADIPVSHSSSYTEPGKPTSHSTPIARPNTSMSHSSSFTEPNMPVGHSSPIPEPGVPIRNSSSFTEQIPSTQIQSQAADLETHTSDTSNNSVVNSNKKKRIRNPAKRLEAEKRIYILKPPCNCKCIRKCTNKYTEEERQSLWLNFRNLDKQNQRNYISRNVTRKTTSVKTTDKTHPRRQNTLIWKINNVVVCKTFFLNTLGFKNDQTVNTVLKANYKNGITNPEIQEAAPEQRGKHKPKHAFSSDYKDNLKKFIEDVKPTVSHYNLKHAPNRKYLPCGVSFTDLHKAFLEHCKENNMPPCSWTYFHSAVAEMNLSTSNPRQDLCTTCQIHKEKHSETDHLCSVCKCDVCNKFEPHNLNKTLSRELLVKDTELKDPKRKVYTADMQKAICMPKLTVKEYFFSRKLVLLNETFVPPGKDEEAHCVIWHEGEAGRKAHNIASAYIQFLTEHCRDLEQVTFYTDNCTSQNKNRVLYAACMRFINSKAIHHIQNIKFVYLEPGHTYMAADTVHACIANKFERQKEIYDLADFRQKIKSSRKNMNVRTLTHSDMILFDDGILKKKFPKGYNIANLKIVEFRRGNFHIYVKNSYTQESFLEVDITRKELITSAEATADLLNLPRESKPRGVSKVKKEDLLKLCESMPMSRRKFFEDLLIDTRAIDLDTTPTEF